MHGKLINYYYHSAVAGRKATTLFENYFSILLIYVIDHIGKNKIIVSYKNK